MFDARSSISSLTEDVRAVSSGNNRIEIFNAARGHVTQPEIVYTLFEQCEDDHYFLIGQSDGGNSKRPVTRCWSLLARPLLRLIGR